MKKIFLLSIVVSFLFTNLYADDQKDDCSKIKNIYKKLVCKTDNATSSITSKKTLSDFWKKK